jgi:hypothetical protein
MSSEQDNGHYNDGLTNLTLMYEREGYFDDERELQMEQEMERIDALGGYDDEPVRVEKRMTSSLSI